MKIQITAKLKALIPQKISNKTVLAALTILSKFYSVPEAIICSNAKHNVMVLCNKNIFDPAHYIENQNEWEPVKFGRKYSMSYSGCEIIAVCNALHALGEDMTVRRLAALISTFEHSGAVLGGLFGTAPYAIEKYFAQNGYALMTTDSTNREIINSIGERNDTVIVTAYNDKNDIMKQVHTVCITKEENGAYAVHNAYYRVSHKYRVKGEYATLQDAINNISATHPASISVMGICKM